MTSDTQRKPRSWLARAARGLAVILGGLAVVVVAGVVILLLPPARARILSKVLTRADAVLPGEFSIGKTSWPSLESVEFTGILWVDGADSLLSADRVFISVDLLSLFKKDVRIESVFIEGVSANVPAIQARFAKPERAPSTAEKKQRGFPRHGSIPGLPSVAAERIRLTAPSIRLSAAGAISGLIVDVGFDLTPNAPPWVRVDTLAMNGPADTWRVDGLSLYVAPDRGVIEGRGSGAVSPHWPARFSVSPLGKDRFKLVLSTDAEDAAAISTGAIDSTQAEIGAWFDVGLAREGVRVRSATFDGRIRTPGTADISQDPAFAQRVEGLPDLDGLGLNLRGTAGFGEKLTADVTCTLEKNNWIEGGVIAATLGKEGLSLQRVALDFPDLSLVGAGSLDADSMKASAEIRVKGSRWLDTFLPAIEHPEPFSATIGVEAARASGGSVVRARVTAEGRVGDFALDGLGVNAELSLDGAAASRVVLTAAAMDLHLGIAAEVIRQPDILVSLAPIILQRDPVPPSSIVFSERTKGTLRYSAASKTLLLEGVRVTGDMGDLTVDAELDPEKHGPFSLAYRLMTPPPVLLDALKLSGEKARSLREQWATDAPFSLVVKGDLISTEGPRITGSGTFSLPGPRNFAALLPDSARLEDLGPLGGEISFSTAPDSAGMGFVAELDFDSTEWIGSSVVRVRGRPGEVLIDTAGVAVEGVSAGVSGRIDHGVFDVTAKVSMSDPKFARRFAGAVPDGNLEGRVDFRGTPQRPVLSAKFDGSLKGKGFAVPEFTAEVDLDTTRVAAVVRAPAGITTPQVRLNRAVARAWSVEGEHRLFPIRISLDAAGEKLALRQSLHADTTGGVIVDVDTLELAVGSQDLRARRPFRIRPLTGRGGFSIEDVDLSGTLGTVRFEGVLQPDSSDITGAVSIVLPENPPPALTRPHLWPRSIELDFAASGSRDVKASLHVSGFTLVDERRPVFGIEMESHEDQVEAVFTVTDSLGEIVRCRGTVPAAVTIYPPSVALRDGPISADAVMDRVPLVARLVGPGARIPRDEIIRLNGRLVAGGTAASPAGAAKLSFEFTDWPKLSQYRAEIEAVLGSRAGLDSLMNLDRVGVSRELTKDVFERLPRGLAASFRLERERRPVLSVRAAYPLHVSLNPYRVRIPEDGRVDVRVESEEIPLSDFDPLLPLDIGLGGYITLAFKGEGPVHDFTLDGKIATRDLEISMADKARLVAKSDVRLSGTSARPVIKGDVEIASGLIRVPDMPKTLHAREGKAILWRDSLTAAAPDTADTAAATRTVTRGAGEKEKRRFAGEIDVSIRIPSGFWIRGKGLDIELAGDLNVREKDGRPIVTGELRAMRGDFIVLGRTLNLERGTVTFYGGDETNPSLDISLTTNVEGTKIEILFGGTAQKPRIDMRSEPDMPETDIVSVLLFGSGVDNLDDNQADLVKKRSTEMIASLGAAKLQEEIGGELGVDVVTVKSTGADSEGSAVSLGKYLNPRTLLSYAYPLDSQSPAFVSLEYFLKGRFVVQSMYDNEGLGSLGVGWSKDY